MKLWKRFILWLIVHICGVSVGLITAHLHNGTAIVLCSVIGFVSGITHSMLFEVFINKE